ncbi:MAG: RluA family pseudouridine synthase [Alphaproteobacteria bacterium]|nr:RluA family pseudouridine synthase [Alphaproteobacteria bacterium]
MKLFVTNDTASQRLDKFLVQMLPEQSRNRLQDWIERGCVCLDEQPIIDTNYKVKDGQTFTLTIPALQDSIPKAEILPLDIVYEDDDLVVINKAPGMVVHPAPGHYESTMVNALLAHCGDSLSGIGGVKRPGIVHRLDKDTSGLLVVAKNDKTHQALSEQFSNPDLGKQLKRTYWGLAWGHPLPSQSKIETPIGRHPKNRQKMAVVHGNSGKESVTHYTTKQVWNFGSKGEMKLSWLEFTLETGRTHQIRVHCQHIGCPIIGDPLYGKKTLPKARLVPDRVIQFERQALHAVTLSFLHPHTQETMTFEATPPEDFLELLEALNTFL